MLGCLSSHGLGTLSCTQRVRWAFVKHMSNLTDVSKQSAQMSLQIQCKENLVICRCHSCHALECRGICVLLFLAGVHIFVIILLQLILHNNIKYHKLYIIYNLYYIISQHLYISLKFAKCFINITQFYTYNNPGKKVLLLSLLHKGGN